MPSLLEQMDDLNVELNALNARQADIEREASAKNGGRMSATQEKEWDRLNGEYNTKAAERDAIGNQVKKQDERRKRSEPTAQDRKVLPYNLNKKNRDGESEDQLTPTRTALGRGRLYAEMFCKPGEKLDNGGFSDSREFISGVMQGHTHDNRLVNLSMGEYSDPYGGFAVPPEFSALMLDSSLPGEIVRPRARVVPMLSSEKIIPRWDGYDRSTGLTFGGIQTQWVAEGNPPAVFSKGKLEQMKLRTASLLIYGTISNLLLDDAPEFGDAMDTAISSAIGFDLDSAFLTGTGAGLPLGALNDPAKITVAKEVGQASKSIVYDNLIKMFARLHDGGDKTAVWVCNRECLPQLLTMSITVGTGGTAIPMMLSGPNGYTMLTLPVIFTEKVPALGTEGDISLIDFSQYTVGMRAEMRLDKSGHIGFAENETAFRAILRADGRGSWRTVLTPKHGATRSWVVTLAPR